MTRVDAPKPLRIVFAGTPEFAAHHLSTLIDSEKSGSIEIVGVYTQPDRPAGRGKKVLGSAVKEVAQANGLPVYQPISLKDDSAQAVLRDLNPDLMIVVAYGLILPPAVLDIPTNGCINVHASLLPRWRGAAPIQRAIEAGDKITGITIMQMDQGLDTGDMLFKVDCTISNLDTSKSLHDKLCAIGAPLVAKAVNSIKAGCLEPIQQDNALSTYASKVTKQEAAVNWRETAETIDLKIRAFNPFPIAYTDIDGKRVRVHEAYPLEGESTQALPGTIIRAEEEGIDVATGSGILRIRRLQLPGKKVLASADIIRGNASLFPAGQEFTHPPSSAVE